MNQEGMDDRHYFSDWPSLDCGDEDCQSCYPYTDDEEYDEEDEDE